MTGVRYCSRCQNHGQKVVLKGHKRQCPHKSCNCEQCKFTSFRQAVMANDLHCRRRRSDVMDENDVIVEPTGKVRHQDDTVDVRSSQPIKRRHESLYSEGSDVSIMSNDSSSTNRSYNEDCNINNIANNNNVIRNHEVNGAVNYKLNENSDRLNIQGAHYVRYMDSYHGKEGPPLQVASNGITRPLSDPNVSPQPLKKDPPLSDPRPGSAPRSDDLSVISSIILRFCANDPNKAVRCVEKAYKELLKVAYPDQPHDELTSQIHQPPSRRPDLAPKVQLTATSSQTLIPSQEPLVSQRFLGVRGPLITPGPLVAQEPLQASHGLMRPVAVHDPPHMHQASHIIPQVSDTHDGSLSNQSTIGLATLLTPNSPSYRLVWNPPCGVSPGSIVLGGPLDIERNGNGHSHPCM